MNLSVVVVTYNSEGVIDFCLKQLANERGQTDITVIVVDNASQDKTIKKIESEFPWVQLIKNPSNLGYGLACNIGFARSKTPYILFSNPDIQLNHKAISAMLQVMERNPRCGVVGCCLLNEDGTLQKTCNRFPDKAYLITKALGLHQRWPSNPFNAWNTYADWDRTTPKEVDAVSGACMLIRSQAFEQVGMFDEKFFLYWEEFDLCARIKKAGWKVVYTPEASLVHLLGSSTRLMGGEWWKRVSRASHLYFSKKYYGKFWAALNYLTFLLKDGRV